MENLEIYKQIEDVPEVAKKSITGGRLRGMTDIKPMWRIEMLTQLFGPCGIGWKAPITKKEIIDGADGEKIAVVDIDLYYKYNGEWSEPVQGTGGSSFIAKEKNGYYTSDECFKMAYTDALSVACKSLGMGAKVYWGDSKYSRTESTEEIKLLEWQTNEYLVTEVESKAIYSLMTRKGLNVVEELKKNYGIDNTKQLTKEQYMSILKVCNGLPDKEKK